MTWAYTYTAFSTRDYYVPPVAKSRGSELTTIVFSNAPRSLPTPSYVRFRRTSFFFVSRVSSSRGLQQLPYTRATVPGNHSCFTNELTRMRVHVYRTRGARTQRANPAPPTALLTLIMRRNCSGIHEENAPGPVRAYRCTPRPFRTIIYTTYVYRYLTPVRFLRNFARTWWRARVENTRTTGPAADAS